MSVWTDNKIAKLHGKNLYALGNGLSVREKRDGRKYYVFIYRQRVGDRRGKKIELTFGPTAKLDVNDAYDWARDQSALIAKGIDPQAHKIAEKQKAQKAALKTKTFKQVAQEYYTERTDPGDPRHWRKDNAKIMKRVKERIAEEAPAFNNLLVHNIEPADVAKKVMDLHRKTAPVLALRFRDFIIGALDLANDEGCAPEGYNRELFKRRVNRLAPIRHTSTHHPGWHHKDAPGLYALLLKAENDCSNDGLWTTAQAAKAIGRERFSVATAIKRGHLPAVKGGGHGKTSTWLVKPSDVAKRFDIKAPNADPNFGEGHLAIPLLRLLQLTAVRFSEASNMTWDEIDKDKRLWKIPAERTKSQRKHLVPLIDEVWAIIEKMQARGVDSRYVFARGPTLTGADFHLGKPLTRECVIAHLRKASGDPTITIHAFRRNCRSWVEEQLIYWKVIGRALLGHAISSGLDEVYGGDAEFEVPCRRALNAWTDYLKYGRLPAGSQSAEVIPLSSERRTANA